MGDSEDTTTAAKNNKRKVFDIDEDEVTVVEGTPSAQPKRVRKKPGETESLAPPAKVVPKPETARKRSAPPKGPNMGGSTSPAPGEKSRKDGGDRIVGDIGGPTWSDMKEIQGNWEERFKALERVLEGERQRTTGLRSLIATLQRQNTDLQLQLDDM